MLRFPDEVEVWVFLVSTLSSNPSSPYDLQRRKLTYVHTESAEWVANLSRLKRPVIWATATILGFLSLFVTVAPLALLPPYAALDLLAIILALLPGAIAGLIAGVGQAISIKNIFPRARLWIVGTSLGWGIGFAAIYVLYTLINNYRSANYATNDWIIQLANTPIAGLIASGIIALCISACQLIAVYPYIKNAWLWLFANMVLFIVAILIGVGVSGFSSTPPPDQAPSMLFILGLIAPVVVISIGTLLLFKSMVATPSQRTSTQ